MLLQIYIRNYVKCTSLSIKDQFLCDILLEKGEKVVGYHQSGDSHKCKTSAQEKNCCCVGLGIYSGCFVCSFGFFQFLFWRFWLHFWGGDCSFFVLLFLSVRGFLLFLFNFERLLTHIIQQKKIGLTQYLELKTNLTDFACSESPRVKPFQ